MTEYRTERQLIGLLLRHPTEIVRVSLRHEHFADPFCALAFMAMRQCVTDGLTPDVVTVAMHMPDDPVGELAGLWQDAIGSGDNIPHLCGLVRKGAKGRNIAALLAKAQEALVAGKETDLIRSRLITRLSELDDDERLYTHTGRAWMGGVVDYLQAAFDARHNGTGLVGVPSGIEGLDNVLGGFHRSDLVVVGARPKMGKTSWMMSIAYNAAKAGRRVGIISAEMPAYQLGLRLVSMMSAIDSSKLRACDLDEQEHVRLTQSTTLAAELPIFLYDKPACTPGDVAIQARAWAIAGGIDLLFVDYLTRLSPDENNESRTREVGKMVADLKTIARTLDIPVICLAQLSRKVEERRDKRPLMSDLRDSGEIEQEADVVMFLYRDCVYEKGASEYDAEILVEANRHGPSGKILCGFHAERMQWVNHGA